MKKKYYLYLLEEGTGNSGQLQGYCGVLQAENQMGQSPSGT